jgi:ferrous iron transport protein B
MSDLAQPRGIRIEADTLARELGAPVVATVGVARDGDAALRALLADPAQWQRPTPEDGGAVDTRADHERVRAMLEELGLAAQVPDEATERIDRVVLHPVAGPLLLVAVLFRGAGGFAMALTRIATGEASLSGATPPPS